MSFKLGELLINEGIITQAQLDEALKCHIIFGLKLGSSLIELGFIREEVLLDLLSRKLGVPPVNHAELDSVPPEVIARLSRAVAERFRVIPVRQDNRRLYLAMSDPTDFKAQEELSFMTGNLIVPTIAPDILINQALEKYYNVRMDHRCMNASLELKNDRSEYADDDRDAYVTDGDKYTICADIQMKADPGSLLNVTIPKEPDPKSAAANTAPGELTASQTIELYTIDKLSLDFSKADNRNDVAGLFIRYLGQEFSRCALLTLRGNMAIGWRAVVNGKQVQGFEHTPVEASKSTELNQLFSGKALYSGCLEESQPNLPLTTALNLSAFNTVLCLPMMMNDRPVAIIVVSSDAMSLQRKQEELQKLVYKASLAFQIIVLKSKLLQT